MKLFTSLRIRDIQLKNRIVVSPMGPTQPKMVTLKHGTWYISEAGQLESASLVMTEAFSARRIWRPN